MRFLCLAFVLLWPVAAVAADFNAGFRAYKRGDYTRAMRKFRPLAEQGDAAAQFGLGSMYAKGEGVPKDDRKAAKWYRKAAEQGDARAQFNLGLMYAKGQGVPKDNREAVKWYRKAATQGFAEAQYNLGLVYATGRGVPKDAREAVKWYRKAAAQGLAGAQKRLAGMYYLGEGVPKDYVHAYAWFNLAAAQGDADAQNLLGFMYDFGEGVPKDAREAVKWYRKAATQGLAIAQYNLGRMYANGRGVPKDNRDAVKWYRKAAEQGFAGAQKRLADMYYLGKGVLKDAREAVKWSRKAAAQGDAAAQYNLGLMYLMGDGVPKDNREAVTWYRKAAEQGHALAQNNLGVMYAVGKGVPKDYVHAYAWSNLAAAQGEVKAAEIRDIAEKRMTPSQIARAQSLSKALVQRISAAAAANSTGTPAAAARPAIPSRYLVKEAQTLLARIGYRPGPADGLPGRRTEHAVKAFQSARNMTPNGVISDELVALLRIAAAAAAKAGRPNPSTGASRRSSGSGFFVSTDGHLVTNRHVIEGCGKVTMTASGSRFDATVLSVDGPNDLALLKAGGGQREPAVLRSLRRAALGERVTVAGFPLSGLLADDLNVTSGAISALAGLGNNPRVIQITAPVQSGNSGGPLLDKSGQVIGVVVSKLNAPKVYKATGELPQNINFAVKGALLRGFLDIHGVNYRTGDTGIVLSGETVAARARRFVVSVGCWK